MCFVALSNPIRSKFSPQFADRGHFLSDCTRCLHCDSECKHEVGGAFFFTLALQNYKKEGCHLSVETCGYRETEGQ